MHPSSAPTGPFPAGQAAPVAGLQDLFDGVTTTEGRLAVTVGVVLVTAVLVVVVAPWIARRLGSRAPWTAPTEKADDGDPGRSGFTVAVSRSLQVAILAAAAASALVLWGSLDEVIAVLDRNGRPVEILLNLVTTAVVVLVSYVGMGVLDDVIARFSAGSDRITDHQEEIVRRLGQLAIMALAIATTLTVWGADLSGLLVGAGFLGIVVGLAARQTLGSLIAGLVLMFSRPFTIGDWVQIGDQEGIVTDITIVNTRLENFDGEFVVLPNDMVGNKPITNRSRKGHLRLRLDVGVDYDSEPDHAREVALDAMREVEAIEQTPPPQAFLKSFGDSAVVVELRYWIDRPTPPRKWLATNAVIEAVKAAFERDGIKIPFPQRELTGRAETGGFRMQSAYAGPEGGRGGRGQNGLERGGHGQNGHGQNGRRRNRQVDEDAGSRRTPGSPAGSPVDRDVTEGETEGETPRPDGDGEN